MSRAAPELLPAPWLLSSGLCRLRVCPEQAVERLERVGYVDDQRGRLRRPALTTCGLHGRLGLAGHGNTVLCVDPVAGLLTGEGPPGGTRTHKAAKPPVCKAGASAVPPQGECRHGLQPTTAELGTPGAGAAVRSRRVPPLLLSRAAQRGPSDFFHDVLRSRRGSFREPVARSPRALRPEGASGWCCSLPHLLLAHPCQHLLDVANASVVERVGAEEDEPCPRN